MATEDVCISIDSRFRDAPGSSTDSDFTVTLPEPYRNVTKAQIVSAEIPVFYHSFGTNETTILQVRRGPDASGLWTYRAWETITIPTGNYTADALAGELQGQIGTALGFAQLATDPDDQGFVVNVDAITGRTTMYINLSSAEWGTISGPSGNDIRSFDINLTPVDLNSAYSYGVAQGDIVPLTSTSYLEEVRVYAAAIRAWSESIQRGTPVLRDLLGFSDFLMYGLVEYVSPDHFGLYGHPYLLLQINDYDVIDHITGGSIVRCFAKLSMDERGSDNGRERGGGYAFSHTTGAVAYPKIFDQPENITRLRVRVLTPMGEVVDLLGARLSFTIRIQHIRDSRQYDKHRDEYIPAGPITGYRSPGVLPQPDPREIKRHTHNPRKLRNVRISGTR